MNKHISSRIMLKQIGTAIRDEIPDNTKTEDLIEIIYDLKDVLINAGTVISELRSGREMQRLEHERDEMEKKYIEMRYEYMASACDRAQLRGENNDK